MKARLVWLLALVTLLPIMPVAQTVPPLIDLKTARELMAVNNPLLLRERQNISMARSDLRGAGLVPNPEIELSSGSYPLFESRRGPFLNNQELTFQGSQTIETAGKRRKRTAFAQQSLAVAQSEVANTQRSLELELKQRFFAALLAQLQLEVARQVAEQFDVIVRVNDARYKQGEVSGLEYARIQAERSRFFTDVLEAELATTNAKLALGELIGLPVGASFDLKGTLDTAPVDVKPDQLRSEARRTRPDVLAQQYRVERGARGLELQRALAMPNVTVFAGYRRDLGANTSVFGLNVPLPLFNRNQGGIGRAQAESQAQQFEFQRITLQVDREIEQAVNSANAQRRRLDALRDTFLPNAKKARDIAQESYRLGALDLVALLDAERSYREIIRSYNQALFDHRLALAQLEAASGKDLIHE